MGDLSQLFSNPGLWLALAAVVLNLVSRMLATKAGQDRPAYILWMKIVALALAVGGLFLVMKDIFW